MKTVRAYDIDIIGVEHEQYFQGAGLSLTDWEDVSVGIGVDAREAYEDALEGLSQGEWDVSVLEGKVKPHEAVLPEDAHEELHVYVAVYVS